ncbi:MAG: hypothetical protein GXO61_00440 [Epsilonproteobacteria bacterium]|nr:hypothetical protein [Campylobacterota bacterium]
MSLSTSLMVGGLLLAAIDIFTTGYLFPLAIALFFTGLVSLWVSSKTFLYLFFGGQVVLYYALFIVWNKRWSVKIEEEKIGFVKRKDGEFYVIDFPTGYKGEVRWKALSQTPLDIGDKVKVVKIDGNILIVEKV